MDNDIIKYIHVFICTMNIQNIPATSSNQYPFASIPYKTFPPTPNIRPCFNWGLHYPFRIFFSRLEKGCFGNLFLTACVRFLEHAPKIFSQMVVKKWWFTIVQSVKIDHQTKTHPHIQWNKQNYHGGWSTYIPPDPTPTRNKGLLRSIRGNEWIHSKLPRPNSRSKLSREPLGSSSRSLGDSMDYPMDGLDPSEPGRKKTWLFQNVWGFPKMVVSQNGWWK